MEMLAVGKAYPTPCPAPGADFALIGVRKGGSFDLLIYLSRPSATEIEAAKTGKLTYAMFVSNNIPFFCVEFETFNISSSINALKIDEKQRDAWIAGEANAVNLILIDSDTNKVCALRMIGLEKEPVEEMKTACKNQLVYFEDSHAVDNKIQQITNLYTTDDMLVHAQRFTLKAQ